MWIGQGMAVFDSTSTRWHARCVTCMKPQKICSTRPRARINSAPSPLKDYPIGRRCRHRRVQHTVLAFSMRRRAKREQAQGWGSVRSCVCKKCLRGTFRPQSRLPGTTLYLPVRHAPMPHSVVDSGTVHGHVAYGTCGYCVVGWQHWRADRVAGPGNHYLV